MCVLAIFRANIHRVLWSGYIWSKAEIVFYKRPAHFLKVLSNGTGGGGGCEWYQSMAFNSSTFPPILENYLEGPGPLKNKKRL
jgi:hypothetical protein